MGKHVLLLNGKSSSAPAPALLEALHEAGVSTEVTALAFHSSQPTIEEHMFLSSVEDDGPLAIVFEIAPEADIAEIDAAIKRASISWPDTPLIACRRYQHHDTDTPSEEERRRKGRGLDASALRRLGFRAIADDPAQLPALLRMLEENGSGSLLPEKEQMESAPLSAPLPNRLAARQLRVAFDIVASLHFATDQKNAAQKGLAGLASLIPADRWTLFLTSATSGAGEPSFEPLAVLGLTMDERVALEDNWRRALLGDVLVLSGTESQAARAAVASAEIIRKKEGERRIVAVPLVSGEKVIGVLEAIREADQLSRPFSPRDIALLTALTVPLAAALANATRIAEAERLSQTDDLTKLHNARFLRQYLISEIKRARRYGSSVAALFLDLDDFKQVNDNYGHLAGSHVLMEMASVILSSVRDTDVVARYGGDEFVVLLPETGHEAAACVAERVRTKVADHEFMGGRRLGLRLTASFGVAVFPQHASSPQQLIAAADEAMYRAKAEHKNCVCFPAEPFSN